MNRFYSLLHRITRLPLRKAAAVTTALFILIIAGSCEQPFSLYDTLDGPDGIPLEISPGSVQVATSNTQTFTAEGGVPPYTFSVLTGSGAIDSSTGLYTAPGITGTAVIQVTDSFGGTAEADVTITAGEGALSISPGSITIYTGSTITFSVSGGQSPYTFSVDNGSINSSTGLYTAPGTAGTATVTVTDDLLDTDTASVTITNIVTNIDYAPSAPNDTSATHIGGDAISGDFTVTNSGTADGTQSITWKIYISSDTSVGAGDDLIDSGTTSALAAGATSASIPFTGTWPETAGTYFLISETSSSDDITTGNNTQATGGISVTDPLSLSPVNVSVLTGGNIAFSAAGGTPVYTYSITASGSGSPSINSSTGAYVAGNSAGTDTVRVTDSLGATSDATVTVTGIVTNVDYGTVTVSNTGATLGGGSLTGEFIFTNSGSAAGSQTVNYEVYISTDTAIGAGDDLIDSGTTSALAAGATSAAIPFTGTWPDTGGTYYLVAKVSASDDVTTVDNIGNTPVVVSDKDIDYIVTAGSITSSGSPAVEGNSVAETFSITNDGTSNGSSTVYWTAYISSDTTLDYSADDVPIDSGQITALNAGAVSSSQNIDSGTWPQVSGSTDYYLFVDVSAMDETAANTGNNYEYSTVTVTDPDIDYSVTTGSITTVNSPANGGSSINESFTITNYGTNDGTANVYWTAYISSDTTLDFSADDIPVDSGQITALTSGTESASQSIDNGKWPSVTSTADYYLFVSISAMDDIDTGNNSDYATFSITVPPNIDYQVASISYNYTSYLINDSVSETFVVKNTGDSAGSELIYWNAYISADQSLDGGDTNIDSGSTAALAASATSGDISITGSWPGTAGTYYLIITVSSADEINSSNNSRYSNAFNITDVAPSEPDYMVTQVSHLFTTVTTGSAVSETFSLRNAGDAAGTQPVNWSAYVSTDSTLDGGDELLDSGTTSALGIGVTSSGIPINANWTGTAGSYYLFVEVSAADETNTVNNSNYSGIFTVYNPPDYSVTFGSGIKYADTLGLPISGTPTFIITNESSNTGMNPVSWDLYYSKDKVLSGDDTPIGSGTENALAGGANSQLPISFTWTNTCGIYYLIARINAGDDENLNNNQTASYPIALGKYTYTETADAGDALGNGGGSGWVANDLTSLALLQDGESIAISGTMDSYGEWDLFGMACDAAATKYPWYRVSWDTGFDDIDVLIYDNSDGTSAIDGNVSYTIDGEPAALEIADTLLYNDYVYYFGVNFWLDGDTSGSAGQPYCMLISLP